MPLTSWGDRVTEKLRNRLVRSQAKIDATIHRPEPLRRPDTKDLLVQFMTDPEGFEQTSGYGREALAQFVKETYGIHARSILPYIMPEGQVETDERGLPAAEGAFL